MSQCAKLSAAQVIATNKNIKQLKYRVVLLLQVNLNTVIRRVLTYVSGQWRVRPWQRGGRTGQDEAFPVTGSATRTQTHRRTKSTSIFVFIIFNALSTPHANNTELSDPAG